MNIFQEQFKGAIAKKAGICWRAFFLSQQECLYQPVASHSAKNDIFFLINQSTTMASNLTGGAVMRMYKGEPCPKPVVQVIDVKQIQGPNGQATQQERFR